MTEQQGRPPWAARIRAERQARNWSQADAVRALRMHSTQELVDDATLIRNWKRWEAGGAYPDDFYRPLLAKSFGTVTNALFPREGLRDGDAELLAATGANTLEIVTRLRASDLSPATIDGLQITVDRLCSEYPHLTAPVLLTEGQQWIRRIGQVLEGRLTLSQHREVLTLAGWLALLVGCVEYDMGDRAAAETTRRAALSLGAEAGHAGILGWAHEMRAWFALTSGDYRGVIAASDAGRQAAGTHSVSVQLAAQSAKAWARIGDRRQLEVALDQGRELLETLAYPDNLDHHFAIDPAKFDFYAMDTYRLIGEDKLAELYAHEVLRVGTGPTGQEPTPMRNAEARITLGVAAARRGELEEAVAFGERALMGERQSLPSLVMGSRELGTLLQQQYPNTAETSDYLERLRTLTAAQP